MTDVELNRRLLVPAVLLALQEMVEEPLLDADAVVRVEQGPVRSAMHFQPLAPGRGADEALDIAPEMQAVAAPVRRRQKRNSDLVPIGRPPAVIVAVEDRTSDVKGKSG